MFTMVVSTKNKSFYNKMNYSIENHTSVFVFSALINVIDFLIEGNFWCDQIQNYLFGNTSLIYDAIIFA